MPAQRRVTYWLILAATLSLVVGVFAYQQVNRRSALAGAQSMELRDQAMVVASSALALLSVVIAGWQMRAESRRRQQVELQLQRALSSVEGQVAARTDALSRTMADLQASEQQYRLITGELQQALDERAEALATAESARHTAEEASHVKDEFLATASHELRTPLNAIVGWVHVLQSGAGVNEAQRQHAVNAIDRNAKIQTRLIEDLLDVSRMIQGRVSLTVTPLDLRTIVDLAIDTVRPSAAAKDLAVHVVRPDAPVPVMADAQRLQQVVSSLVSNAVKYTPHGGVITVVVKTRKDQAEVVVSDTGEGIAPEFIPHLFQPFRQGGSAARRSGMGLGLTIVQRLVDLHGGRVEAASMGVGRGADFTVSLPLGQGLVTERSTSDAVLRNLHVLVAEDDVDSAAAVTAILQMHGCETQTAGTAAECLRIAAEWPTDVLVCDIGLPDDDGYGLLRRLHSLPEGDRIPAIALTAYTRPEDRAHALAAGFRAHLSKPLDPASLLREIASAVTPTVLH